MWLQCNILGLQSIHNESTLGQGADEGALQHSSPPFHRIDLPQPSQPATCSVVRSWVDDLPAPPTPTRVPPPRNPHVRGLLVLSLSGNPGRQSRRRRPVPAAAFLPPHTERRRPAVSCTLPGGLCSRFPTTSVASKLAPAASQRLRDLSCLRPETANCSTKVPTFSLT